MTLKTLATLGDWRSLNRLVSDRQNRVKNLLGTTPSGDKVFFTERDRANHTHSIGSTGTGKSKLFELLIRQDILESDAGLCVLDPHGQLYDELVLYVSHHHPFLADRLILFNPAGEDDHLLGFNPIPQTENFHYALVMLIQGCLKAWGQDDTKNTPRIRRWLYNILYPIVVNKLTIMETVPFLNLHAREEREVLLSEVTDEVVLADWVDYERASPANKRETLEGAANRLNLFLQNPIVRNVLGQREKYLDLRKVMDEGKILFINLSSGRGGKITDDDKKLLGIMIVNEIFRLAKLRDYNNPNLKPFYFFIDEFATFVTRDVARAIEECRKFKLSMILAHQYLGQLKTEDPYLYYSVMTNCKNKIVFGGLCYEDTELMAKELVTGFTDLKAIKHQTERTYFKPVEEFIEVVARTTGKTAGTTHTQNTDRTTATSSGSGEAQSSSRSRNRRFNYKLWDVLPGDYNLGSGTNWGQTSTTSNGTSEARREGSSNGTSESHSESETVTVQPHTRHEEQKEIASTEFWSKDDLVYMAVGQIKNQKTGQATIKIGANPPVQTIINRVEEVFYHPEESPKLIEAFKAQVFLAHSDIYVPVSSLKALPSKAQVIEAEFVETDKEKESPFNG
jgi:hypothetical protein